MPTAPISPKNIILIGFILTGLYLSSLHSYLLFHSLVELFSIVVATGIFMLTWNARMVMRNNYLFFLGISYLFVGLLGLAHFLSYKGMGFFSAREANLATQFWISARYMEAFSMLLAPLFLKRDLKPDRLMAVFALTTAAVVAAAFVGIFPDCFIEGQGLTPFKKWSEYLISSILFLSFLFLHKKKDLFDPQVYSLIAASIFFTIAAELTFSTYVHVFGVMNLFGHFFMFISFYLIYKAIIETGLKNPYELLFVNLKRSQERLRASEQEYRSIFELSAVGMAQIDPATQLFVRVNERFCKIIGYTADELKKLTFSDITHPDYREGDMQNYLRALRGESNRWVSEKRYVRKDNSVIWGKTTGTVIFDKFGRPVSAVKIIEDITKRKWDERKLKVSEWRFKGTFDNAAVGVAHVSLEGNFLHVNRKLCDILGYTEEELRARNFHRLSDPKDLDACLLHEKRLAFGEVENYTLEKRYIHREGHVIWADLTVSLQRDDRNNPLYFIVVIQDISLRKRFEQSLKESEEKFRLIATHIKDVVWMSTPGMKEMLFINPAYEEVWGSRCESVNDRSQPFLDSIHPADRDQVRRSFSEHFDRQWNVNYRIVRPDGTVRWIEDSGGPINDGEGQARLMLGVARDVSVRKEAEKARENYLQRLTGLFRISTSVLSARNRQDMIQLVVDAAVELTDANYGTSGHGFRQGSFKVGAVSRVGDLPSCPRGGLLRVDRGGVYMDLMEENTSICLTQEELEAHPRWWGLPDGHASLDGLLGVSLTGWDGKVKGLIMVSGKKEGSFSEEDEILLRHLASLTSLGLQHIEAREQAEERAAEAEEGRRKLMEMTRELERSNNDLEQFAYIASHDLQEPLRTVSGFVQLLQRRYGGRLDEKADRFIDYAVEGTENMHRLLTDLLAYSRVGGGQLSLRPLDLKTCVDTVVSGLKGAVKKSRARIECQSMVPFIVADEMQLRQLLQNLLGNAIKFRGERTPHIRISVVRRHDEWLISVSDNGIGIERDYFEQIFMLFRRLHRRGEYSGTGIGLAICKKIAERHGGRLWVDSVKGEGTTFHVALPVRQIKEQENDLAEAS